MNLDKYLSMSNCIDIDSIDKVKQRFLNIAKPINGLGIIEDNFIKCGGIQHTEKVDISKKCVIVMCSDNGVVESGISQTNQYVTKIVAQQISLNKTIVCKMCEMSNADVIAVDVGINGEIGKFSIIDKKIENGTFNITKGAAMSRENAVKSIIAGIEMAEYAKKKEYNLIGCGEMGIGNTTTSSACACVLFNKKPFEVTGRGAGLSSEMLKNKIKVIQQAIDINKPNPKDAIDILSKVGGFDIGAMAGLFIGSTIFNIPVIIDGFVSGIAAVIAYMICENYKDYMIASHCSNEPASKFVIEKLSLKPILFAQMCMGEGTGAATVFPMFDMMQNIYYNMPFFEDMNIEKYKQLN